MCRYYVFFGKCRAFRFFGKSLHYVGNKCVFAVWPCLRRVAVEFLYVEIDVQLVEMCGQWLAFYSEFCWR